jgi:hypothetical protein
MSDAERDQREKARAGKQILNDFSVSSAFGWVTCLDDV